MSALERLSRWWWPYRHPHVSYDNKIAGAVRAYIRLERNNMSVRIRLDETDFLALAKGQVVTKHQFNGEGKEVKVEIILADIGFTVMEGIIDEARKGTG